MQTPPEEPGRQQVPLPPPPPPPAGGAPGPVQVVYVQAPRTNGFAVASLVLGILWLYWVGSILALVFGYVAKGQIDRSGGAQGGRGLAIAGIVLGWVGVATLLLAVVFLVGVRGAVEVVEVRP